MSKLNSRLKRVLGTLGAIAVFVGWIAVYNVGYWFSEGSPHIPQLEGQWWAGYYDTTTFGRQWCVARFVNAELGPLQMALLSPFGAPDIFDVERSSSSETFVYLTFKEQKRGMRIEAKQLYAGKRYYWGQLINGRFGDFWEANDDIRIRGQIVSMSLEHEFAIEPIGEDKLEGFWSRDVRPEQPTPSPADILRAAGVMASDGTVRGRGSSQ